MESQSLINLEQLAVDPQLLRRKIDAVNKLGVVGERRNIGIVSTIVDSRLISCEGAPQSLAGINAGHPGAGKSSVMKNTLRLYPQEQIRTLTSATAKSFFNLDSDLKCKVLVLEEAGSLRRDENLTEVLRILISEGRASHQRSIRDGREFITRTTQVEGPIVFLSTTNCPKLEAQIDDRSIKISPDTSEAQTLQIMRVKTLEAAGIQTRLTHQDLILWQDFHNAMTPHQVVIPYAPKIWEHLSRGQYALSARRAFPRFLSAIKAITILYQSQRKNDDFDRLIADIADYAMAYQLFSSSFLQETTLNVCELTEQRLETIRAVGKVTMTKLAEHEGVTKQAIHNWAKGLLDAGTLCWRDPEGNLFSTPVSLKRAQAQGKAFLSCVRPSALPSPYDLTENPEWLPEGDLFALYDLDLEGIKGPCASLQPAATEVYETAETEVSPYAEILPMVPPTSAVILYNPAIHGGNIGSRKVA